MPAAVQTSLVTGTMLPSPSDSKTRQEASTALKASETHRRSPCIRRAPFTSTVTISAHLALLRLLGAHRLARSPAWTHSLMKGAYQHRMMMMQF